jgi:2-polyprenyl-6-methoxyphenol hydroxylase-like FAD-dependent oxidoreductase
MTTPDEHGASIHCDVAIVGGGPVGLLLGCLLAQRGIDARVFERRTLRSPHSRAVGVHPPGLDCLAAVGVADPLIERAVRVRHAFAFTERRTLGTIDFATLGGPYPFVLTVPQEDTEALLERQLRILSSCALIRGAEVTRCENGEDAVRLEVMVSGAPCTVHARYAIGCEGKHSILRAAAGIAFEGAPYDAHFMMGDTSDQTPFGDAAAIFLTRDGLVESFPMPHGKRRWVVALSSPSKAPDLRVLSRLVRERTGQVADPARASMISSFRAERFLARHFVRGRIALAGDAAHVMSPIGGQGMNMGWLDALCLSEALTRAFATRTRSECLLSGYARERRDAARRATRRAETFMAVAAQGRRTRPIAELTIRALLSDPLRARAARFFTMEGLR